MNHINYFYRKVDNRTFSSVPAAISRSTNSSEGYPTSLSSTRNIGVQVSGSGAGKETGNERTVPCCMFRFFSNLFTRSLHLLTVDFRIIEERRESPIFETDLTVPDKFEASPKSTNHEGQNPNFLVVPAATIPKPIDVSGISPITRSLSAESTKNDFAMRGYDSGSGLLQEERCVHSCISFFPFFSMYVLPTRRFSPLTVGSRETPVFKTGPTATGQYEATFQPNSSTIMSMAPQALVSSLGTHVLVNDYYIN